MLKALLYVYKNCCRAIKEAGNIRHFIFLINLIKFFEYVFMVGSPYFYAWIIDGAASLLGTQPEYDKLILGLVGTFGSGILLYIMISYQGIWSLRINHSITSYTESTVMLKTAKIHFNNLENAKTHEIISKVRSSLPSDTANFVTNSPVFSLLWASGSVVVLSWSLARINGWLAVLVLLSNTLEIGKEMYKAKNSFRIAVQQIPEERISQTYRNILTDRTYLKEIRLYSIKNYLLDKWEVIARKLKKRQLLLSMRHTFLDILIDMVTYGTQMLALYLTVRLILSGNTTVGSFLLVYEASSMLSSRITEMSSVAKILKNIHYNSTFWFQFDAMEECTYGESEGKVEKIQSIRMENVCFRYFGNENDTLRNINLSIEQGEKIAIVGANGSGKTTFVSLINGLYRPRDGKILINNTDIEEYGQNFTRKIVTLSQNFNEYPVSVRENIEVGQIVKVHSDEQICAAAILSGADSFIDALPQKYDTTLGNLVGDGAQLSGGQWQKLALSRLYLNDEAEIFILDEPTASLDANAESQIYESVLQHLQDKTTLFISHRLSVTPKMDRILVFDHGEIVEEGAHEELMQKKGIYWQMYVSQAELYQENVLCSK